jgi:hypothetical protein
MVAYIPIVLYLLSGIDYRCIVDSLKRLSTVSRIESKEEGFKGESGVTSVT